MEENNNIDNPLIIELEDEDGNTVNAEIIGTFEDGGRTYAIANDLNEDSSYIFLVNHTPQGDELVSVVDEEEFNRLAGVIDKLIEEERDDFG